jgi:tetratricopeptide (TPR) repeat protein
MNGVSMIDGFVAYPERHGGAARLSVFFALWTLALVALNDVRVNAAPVYDVRAAHSGPGWWIAPAEAPKVVTERMWDGLAQRSDVISGRWNVASAAPVAKHPKRSVVTAPTIASERAEAPKAVPARSPETLAADEAAVKRASAVSAARAHIARQISARDFGGALESLEQARKDDAGAANQLRLLEAHVAIGRGDLERAYAILLESLPDVRVATQQHDLLAAVMVRTSRYAEAAAIYRALLSVDPANARWWAGYAVTQEKLGHRTELISAYRTLRSLAPPGSALSTWANERLERIT